MPVVSQRYPYLWSVDLNSRPSARQKSPKDVVLEEWKTNLEKRQKELGKIQRALLRKESHLEKVRAEIEDLEHDEIIKAGDCNTLQKAIADREAKNIGTKH